MKKLIGTIKLVVAACVLMPCVSAFADAPTREHRAIWMTPYLGSNWPSSAITAANANSQKNILDKRMVKFRDQNVNILYYHCRVMCDAMYNSAYEPWSSAVSTARGVEPAFDPFGYLLESAHNNGIEVYAWLNPYRYCGTTKYGDKGGDLNYENSHPDWLITQSKETILNPGLEEVKQRIVDVVVDIITKYDVDGIVFDDYFYTSGTPMNLDADLYAKYKAGGGTLSQADWRRANVNEMVARVNKAIKERKPWVVFGIGPAGVASPPNVTSEYGLPPAPGGGDWQYNGIYSDPLAWYKEGSIDYMSPQIYWPSRFDALSQWWADAAVKYGRHCYPSVDISDITTYKYAEFAHEIEKTREVSPAGTSGLVFFQYANFVNYYEKWEGKTLEFGAILGQDVYNTKALVPLRPWTKSDAPEMVTNVKSDGKVLTWDNNPAGRYAIYKFPKTQTSYQLTLDGISYTNSYTLPDDGEDFNWYVATYDRYGNVTAPLGVGATKQTGTAPKLTYPANGEKPVDLFEFKWDHQSNLEIYSVEVAEDASFSKIIGILNVSGKKASVTGLPALTDGKTYYWRVKATDVNCEHPVSESRSFVAPRIALTTPSANASVALGSTFKWSQAVEGADYTLEISKNSDMSSPVYSATVKTTDHKLPAKSLTTGTKYYARVTASLDGASSASDILAFSTEDKNDYPAPTFVTPKANGETLHSNEFIKVAEWDGMANVTIQIATDDTFPGRTSYSYTLSGFATDFPELGNVKISSKNLVDGTTYYVRARGGYYLTTSNATQYTDYTPVMTFKYSSEAGVSDMEQDATESRIEGFLLHVGKDVQQVVVYALNGAEVATYATESGASIDLSALAPGAYLIKAGTETLKFVK